MPINSVFNDIYSFAQKIPEPAPLENPLCTKNFKVAKHMSTTFAFISK
jgi:hypothetical protein